MCSCEAKELPGGGFLWFEWGHSEDSASVQGSHFRQQSGSWTSFTTLIKSKEIKEEKTLGYFVISLGSSYIMAFGPRAPRSQDVSHDIFREIY